MWEAQAEIIKEDKTTKYFILKEGEQITQKGFIHYLINSVSFRSFYTQLLKDSPFRAFYWENPPFSLSTTEQAYEFVLIKSRFFKNILPDTESFKSYFTEEPVVTFQNLGKDAMLVVPTPQISKTPETSKTSQSELFKYIHLGKFLRTAQTTQIDAFWQTISYTLHTSLNQQKIWLNTEGTGVHWLHARLDSRPKYYKYVPYTA